MRRRLCLAHYCGYLTVIALFLTACAGPKGPDVPQETLERGATLYAIHCLSCHGDATGAARLDYVPSHGPDGHTWHHSDKNLQDVIMNGAGEMQEMMREMTGAPEDRPRMPAWKDTFSEDDARAIIAYIKTFWSDEQRRYQRTAPTMMR